MHVIIYTLERIVSEYFVTLVEVNIHLTGCTKKQISHVEECNGCRVTFPSADLFITGKISSWAPLIGRHDTQSHWGRQGMKVKLGWHCSPLLIRDYQRWSTLGEKERLFVNVRQSFSRGIEVRHEPITVQSLHPLTSWLNWQARDSKDKRGELPRIACPPSRARVFCLSPILEINSSPLECDTKIWY